MVIWTSNRSWNDINFYGSHLNDDCCLNLKFFFLSDAAFHEYLSYLVCCLFVPTIEHGEEIALHGFR